MRYLNARIKQKKVAGEIVRLYTIPTEDRRKGYGKRFGLDNNYILTIGGDEPNGIMLIHQERIMGGKKLAESAFKRVTPPVIRALKEIRKEEYKLSNEKSHIMSYVTVANWQEPLKYANETRLKGKVKI